MAVQGHILGGLFCPHVQTGGPDFAGFQRCQQGGFIHIGAPGGVDDDNAVFHLGNVFRVNQRAAVHRRGVDADEVGLNP